MSDIHIDDFHKDSAKILVQLFRSFPRPQLMFVEDICGPDTEDEYGLHSERHMGCFSAMLWLAKAGYIDFDETVRQEAIDQAVLTHKSFTLLSTRATEIADERPQRRRSDDEPLPEAVVAAQQTNISQLRKALREGSSFQLNQVMQQLMVEARNFQ